MNALGGRRLWFVVLGLVAVGFLVDDLRRVIIRLQYPYDLLLWADGFFMTSMLKMTAGEPLYSSVADANSTIYSPGGPYLHLLILGPLGLARSLLANRILHQLWLLLAIGLGTRVVLQLAGPEALRDLPPWGRRLAVLLLAVTLALFAYVNPVADALHPTNPELVVLMLTLGHLAAYPTLSARSRWVALCVLPALGLLAKQTTGLAVMMALSGVALTESATARGQRWARALLPPGSIALTLGALYLWTAGLFKTWAFDIIAAQHFDFWKVRDIYAGYFLLFAPAVGVTLLVAVRALRRMGERDRAWLRAAALLVCTIPFALTALFKAMGGPNNLATVGFLCAVLALPELLGLVSTPSRRTLTLGLLLTATQIALLYPRRRVPVRHDFWNSSVICDYAARRMSCGEKVMLGRGAVCHDRGGQPFPKNQMNSIIEVRVAGRMAELEFYRQVEREEFDVMILGFPDLEWFGRDFWLMVKPRYTSFYQTAGEVEGDFWFHAWQGYATWPVVFFERVRDAGKHRVSRKGLECD